MQFLNFLKFGYYTLLANLFGKSFPLNVMISLTNRCNSRCKYCNIFNRQQRELTTAELKKLMTELKKYGCQRIAFWGGEPLVRDDFAELLNFAKKECGFFVSIDTNGYLVPQKINDLKLADVLVISIDGNEETHNRNREAGSFEKVIRAFETASGKIRLFSITVLTKENLDQIDFILTLAKKYKFYTTFQLLHHSSELAAADEKNYIPSDMDYKRAIQHLITRKKQGYPIVSSLNYLNYIYNWSDYTNSKSINKTFLKCWAGILYANVDTDGSVYPCSVLIGNMPAKNFLETDFKDCLEFARNNRNCNSCNASCFTEYNFMHSFNLSVILNWLKYTRS